MKEKEMSLNLCVTCGFDYTYSLKIFLLPLKLCTCACLGKKRYGSVGMKLKKELCQNSTGLSHRQL